MIPSAHGAAGPPRRARPRFVPHHTSSACRSTWWSRAACAPGARPFVTSSSPEMPADSTRGPLRGPTDFGVVDGRWVFTPFRPRHGVAGRGRLAGWAGESLVSTPRLVIKMDFRLFAAGRPEASGAGPSLCRRTKGFWPVRRRDEREPFDGPFVESRVVDGQSQRSPTLDTSPGGSRARRRQTYGGRERSTHHPRVPMDISPGWEVPRHVPPSPTPKVGRHRHASALFRPYDCDVPASRN